MTPVTPVERQLEQTKWSWSTAQGTIHHWLQRAAVEGLARDFFLRMGEVREHPDRLAKDTVTDSAMESTEQSTIYYDRTSQLQRVLRFLGGESTVPILIVVRGRRWWLQIGTEIVSNERDESEQLAGLEYRALLQPVGVPAYYNLVPLVEENLIGRVCTKVRASLAARVSDTGQLHGAHQFGMVPGGTDFCLWVDKTSGVLLRVAKLLSGQEVEVLEWKELTLDKTLDPTLFEPPMIT